MKNAAPGKRNAEPARRLLGVLGLCLFAASVGSQELYVSHDSWAETMTAARHALEAVRGEDEAGSFSTGILRGRQEPVRIELDVSGFDELWLEADIGDDTYNYDQAIWAEPTLIRPDGTAVRLTALEPHSVSVGWGNLILNKDHLGQPLTIADRAFQHGFWAHAPSLLGFKLEGAYARFEVYVGIGIAAGQNGSSRFHVMDRPNLLDGLWMRLQEDFPFECAAFHEDAGANAHVAWFEGDAYRDIETQLIEKALADIGPAAGPFADRVAALDAETDRLDSTPRLALYAELAGVRHRMRAAQEQLDLIDADALRRAVSDLNQSHPDIYRNGEQHLEHVAMLENELAAIHEGFERGDVPQLDTVQNLLELQRTILLDNPLLDFDEMLLIRRSVTSPALGLPHNWQSNCCLPRTGFSNEIAALEWREDEPPRTVYRPEAPVFVGDLDLDYDARRMLFSMSAPDAPWHVYEIGIDGQGLTKVSFGDAPDVDNYDACYLPDGRIVYGSTAAMKAVPCVDGSSNVATLYLLSADREHVRQLCFDQDHNWTPRVLNNGRILYQRWEYTDTPHSQTRLLFSMNPDGTGQMEYYGSNSYWPNSVFYARPIPGHPTKVVGIVTGHHGVRRKGEMVVFDPARGRREADGAIHRIGSYGEPIEPIIRDALVDDSWPKFLHPYPLSAEYYLVSAKPTPDSLWGIYLVDVFGNMTLIREEPGYALLEPIPLRPRPRPPAIPDKVDESRDDAVIYMVDVHEGPGLDGVPQGAVKALRVFAYNYSWRGMGGLLGVLGMDGPWDIKRVLGTVPVEEDGSAIFRIPANTPVSIQPLDEHGRALQLMRSWFTAMPGEVLSCTGCHEPISSSPPVTNTLASRRLPSEIEPWYGPTRGFSFTREVQPVLDKYCIGCHDGSVERSGIPDLRGDEYITDWSSVTPGQGGRLGGRFTKSYANLHQYIRRPGIESDYHLLEPLEFHARTTELVQMLEKGHHGVSLDEEAWDRINTWIDLNVPFHGYWHEVAGDSALEMAERQSELALLYGGNPENPEEVPQGKADLGEPVTPPLEEARASHTAPSESSLLVPRIRQVADASTTRRSIDIGDGHSIEFVYIPAGSFVMGDDNASPDEAPAHLVEITEPFWMSVCEISNEQFAVFDPSHDSRVESKNAYQFGVHGFPLNEPRQPVVRVTWDQAAAFCAWLSDRSGEQVALPTEAQWEHACRAGTVTPFFYGGFDADFSVFANLADAKLSEFADDPYYVYRPLENPTPYDDWIPKDTRFDDGALVSAPVGRYQPNPWGLHDMHGNVWEWTRSAYRDYPYCEDDGRNDPSLHEMRVVRGGSWRDRPYRATAAYRLAYEPWQRVFNVGFRVVMRDRTEPQQARVYSPLPEGQPIEPRG